MTVFWLEPHDDRVSRRSGSPGLTGRAGRRLPCRLRPTLLASTALMAVALWPNTAEATDATWLTNPVDGSFNRAANWDPALVPNGTAFFGASNQTELVISPSVAIGGWTFNADASDYRIRVSFPPGDLVANTLTFTGAGIVINGGSVTINTTVRETYVSFANSSSAGNATINSDFTLDFRGTSSAGSATINNRGINGVNFRNNSTAGNATIYNNDADLFFWDASTGGTARVINNGRSNIVIDRVTSVGITLGSIEGGGKIFLGSKNLAVGGNNLSTTYSGVAQDRGIGDGVGGSLTKEGNGTLTLTGTNTYTGVTTVNGGALIVNGSIASSSGLVVNGGGSIGGTGALPSTTINGGTLSPGNSIGTATINGNLTFSGNSTYAVEVSPTAADRTNVSGTATLAGTVLASFQPGAYVTRSYVILSATGGLGGTTFNTLTTSNLPAGFDSALSYTATDVLLSLTATLGAGRTLPGNAESVAGAINGYFNAGGNLPAGFLPLFNLTGNSYATALSQLSGEAATGAQQSGYRLMDRFLDTMLDPFVAGAGVGGSAGAALGFASEREGLPPEAEQAYAAVFKAPPAAPAVSFERRWSVWGAAYGGSNRTDGDPAGTGSHDLSASAVGFAAGVDYRVAPDTVVGVALAGGGTSWSLAQGLGGGRSDAFQAGIYGAHRSGAFYVAGALAYTQHWMSTDRFAFGGNHLTASFTAPSVGGRLEGGYRMAGPVVTVTPYAAVQAQSLHTPGYVETDVSGGIFALNYSSRTGTDTRIELGSRFDRQVPMGQGAVLILRGRLAWAHDWVSDPALVAAFQSLPGASFIVNGATPAGDAALVSAGARLALANGVTVSAKFDGEFAGDAVTLAGMGALRYAW